MKKVGSIFLIFILIIGLNFISAQDASDYVGSSGTTTSTTPSTTGTATDPNSVLKVTDKKEVGETISQGLKPEEGGLKNNEATAQNVDIKKVEGEKTKVDFQEKGSVQIKGNDYSNFKKGDGAINNPTITFDKKGKTTDASFTTEKESKIALGNQNVPVPQGAKVEQKDGVIKVNVPEGSKLKEVPKRNEQYKEDQNASPVVYSGKFTLPNGMSVNGDLSFADGQAFVDKGNKALINGVQLQGNNLDQKWVNDRTSVFFDGKEHPEINGAYASLGEKKFVIGSNNELASPAVNFVKGNPYVTQIDDKRFFAMQAYSKSTIGVTNRDAEGLIPLLESKGGGIVSTDNKAFFTENGKLYFRTKNSIITDFGDTTGKLTYPMEFKATDQNGKSLVPPNGKIFIGPNNQFAAININDQQWKIGGQTYSNQWKDSGFDSGQIPNLNGETPRVNVNPDSKEIPIPDFTKYAGKETTFQSKNFYVYSPNGNARMYAENLEFWRTKNAVEWTGKKLPDWTQPIAVTIDQGPYTHSGGGATTYTLGANGEPTGTMEVTGNTKTLLDNVLPHEINHLVAAQGLGSPVPRWIDEGMATYTETPTGRSGLHNIMTEVMSGKKGFDLNSLMNMKEYPRDILPLYAEGQSLTDFLVQKGGGGVDGKRRLFDALKYSRQAGWDSTLQQYYGIEGVNNLQNQWTNWYKEGKARP